MNTVIKNLMMAGIGGAVTYGVVRAVMSALITGTDAASLFFVATVPTVLAAAVVWVIINAAFK